jgi:hypothetical protein
LCTSTLKYVQGFIAGNNHDLQTLLAAHLHLASLVYHTTRTQVAQLQAQLSCKASEAAGLTRKLAAVDPLTDALESELRTLQQGLTKVTARVQGQQAGLKGHERRLLEMVQVSCSRAVSCAAQCVLLCSAPASVWPGLMCMLAGSGMANRMHSMIDSGNDTIVVGDFGLAEQLLDTCALPHTECGDDHLHSTTRKLAAVLLPLLSA